MTDTTTEPLSPPNDAKPWWHTLGRPRWWGAAAGLAVAAADTATMAALGIDFEMNGRDVGAVVAGVFGTSFAVLGFLIGWVVEGRRRDRAAAALIQRQTEAISGMRARLVQSEKLAALGQLGAVIAHEVRNPLAVIRSAAQSLTEARPDGDGEARRACSFITAEIDRLTSVTSSLLTFARPLKLEPRAVSIVSLLDGAALLARDELAAKHVRLERTDAPALPPVHVDPDLMRQVLLGLLTNAAEAVTPGGRIRLGARRAGAGLALDVADSGPGIPAELRGRIFEPFFTTRSRGTGLGLAIARQIVEAHGGHLEVGDAPGGGACFTIRLRAEPVAVAA